jgi:hypothetical protein
MTLVPYSEFVAMTPDQLGALHAKVTFVGLQTRVVQSLGFTGPSTSFDAAVFIPFRRPGVFYGNDDISVRTFVATPGQLEAVIDGAGTVPAVVGGGVASEPFISFGLVNKIGGEVKAFEAILNTVDGALLFDRLRAALTDNRDGTRLLSDLACTVGLLQSERPRDVTSETVVTFSGLRLDRRTGYFIGTAAITNNSMNALSAPLSLVLQLGPNIRLLNADGRTCGVPPVGREFINLPVSGDLVAGATAKVIIQLDNPDREPLGDEETGVIATVLAGPGAR